MWGHVSSECLDIRVGIGDETDEEWAGVRMTTEDADTCGGKVRDARGLRDIIRTTESDMMRRGCN